MKDMNPAVLAALHLLEFQGMIAAVKAGDWAGAGGLHGLRTLLGARAHLARPLGVQHLCRRVHMTDVFTRGRAA
jgi:hypothetical protein